MQKWIIFIFLFLFTFNDLTAQSVQLLARPSESDSILLRWGPTNKEAWILGNRYGYVVTRYTILRGGVQPEELERIVLTPQPLKPAPLSEWVRYEEDRYVAIAAELIFGEVPEVPALSPIAIARQYQQEQNRFSFALFAADQSVTAARLSGLFFADTSARPDEMYLFSVHIAVPDSLPNDSAFAFTGLADFQALPEPIRFTADWGDRQVGLSWNILFLNHIYNSYILEQSTDGINFTPVTGNAMVQTADPGIVPQYAHWTVALPDNQSTWHFRVRGISAFGETGPPSEIVVGRGRIPITSAPVIVDREIINNEKVKLTWEYPEEMNEYILGFRIYRSFAPMRQKELIGEITDTEARTFIDTNPGLTNYYAISVFNEQIERLSSGHTFAMLIDSIPPLPPVDLAGNIDSTGIVRLSWIANTESDIDGYRIYRSNHRDFEFLLISPNVVQTTEFIDSVQLRTLTRNVYYRIRAIDLVGNQSDFSEILVLRRPAVIPPVSPVIQSVAQANNALVIRWINSSSEGVVAHHIYRRHSNETGFQKIATIAMQNETHSAYTDFSVSAGGTYIFQITAENDGRLISEPSSPVQQTAPGGLDSQITLSAESTVGNVRLTWTIQSQRPIERVLIFRAEDDEPLRLFDNTTEDNFIDNVLGFERRFRYRIRVIYQDGSSSDLSNEVIINI